MSPPSLSASASPACFPRVSGDEPKDTMTAIKTATFSPRERG